MQHGNIADAFCMFWKGYNPICIGDLVMQTIRMSWRGLSSATSVGY